MIRISVLVLAVALAAPTLLYPSAAAAPGMPDRATPNGPESRMRTWTGWFSDLQCGSPRVARGDIGPNNPDCVKRCLKDRVVPVFISEQAKALFEVKDYPTVNDDVGYHVELTGTLDERGKAIFVRSVKRLEYVGALCALQRKSTGKD